ESTRSNGRRGRWSIRRISRKHARSCPSRLNVSFRTECSPMNKLSKEKRDKLVLIGLAAIMTIGLWWTFVIGAQSDKLADYTKKIAVLRNKVDGAEKLSRLGPTI